MFISIVDETSLILRCASVSFSVHHHVLVDHGNKTISEYLLIHSFQYAVSAVDCVLPSYISYSLVGAY